MTDSTAENGPHLEVRVWRGDDSAGKYVHYQAPLREYQTILDVVTWIQRNAAPTLSYRFACRVGMCGSCAMMVNGKPRWTCRTQVNKVAKGNRLTLAPLRNLPVIKDLVSDMSEFFDKWQEAQGRFQPSATREDAVASVAPQSAQRRAADAGIECINCAVCYAACDLVTANSKYLGPAALNRAWTLVNDVRDSGQSARLRAVSGSGGCHNCHAQQGCVTYCPNELNPTASIAGLKRATLKAAMRGEL